MHIDAAGSISGFGVKAMHVLSSELSHASLRHCKACTASSWTLRACLEVMLLSLASLCMMHVQVQQDHKLQCEQLQELMQPADLSTLPDNAVIMQQQPAVSKQHVELCLLRLESKQVQYSAVKATFGLALPAETMGPVTGELDPALPCLALSTLLHDAVIHRRAAACHHSIATIAA